MKPFNLIQVFRIMDRVEDKVRGCRGRGGSLIMKSVKIEKLVKD